MNLEDHLCLKYFTEEEINAVSFGCDDGFNHMSIKVLIGFDTLREKLGRPLYPTCMYRTYEYDIARERSGKSDHCFGRGGDFAIKSLADGLEIVAEAAKLGFNAFGINLNKKFVHVGMREGDKITTWNYKNA